jgi:hypothetical protein
VKATRALQSVLIALAAAAACAPSALAQATGDQPAVAIARIQKVGDIQRVKVLATAEVTGSTVDVERTVKSVVKEIKKTGEIVVISTDEGGKVNVGGQERDVPPSGPATITTDKLGRIVRYERPANDMSMMAPEVEQMMAVMQDYLLPEKPVKPGESWECQLPNPLIKDKKVQVKTTFVGLDKHEDAPVWKIKQVVTADVNTEGGKFTAEFVFLADPANGIAKLADGTMKGVPTQYGPLDIKLKAVLLKPEAPKATTPPK